MRLEAFPVTVLPCLQATKYKFLRLCQAIILVRYCPYASTVTLPTRARWLTRGKKIGDKTPTTPA